MGNGKAQFDSKLKIPAMRSSEALDMCSDTSSVESGSVNRKPQFNTRLDSPGMGGGMEKQNIWSGAVESDSLHKDGRSENGDRRERVREATESSPKVKLREKKVEMGEKPANASAEGL